MIIEDDQDIRELCQELLDNEGFSSDAVANGKEAIEYLDRHSEPCVILLDMMMPIMNGREFMSALGKREKRTPVYLVSASADPKEGRAMGCLGFIKKPYNFSEILNVVKNHCDVAVSAQSHFQPGLCNPHSKLLNQPKSLY